MDKTLKNSCGKRGCKVITLPTFKIGIPLNLPCEENNSYERLKKAS